MEMIELSAQIKVRGVCNKHLGPMWARAAATLIVEPAETFAIDGVGPEDSSLERDVYGRSFALGVVEMLKADGSLALGRVRLTVSELEIDPVESSPNAFRQAGREAGRQAAAEWRASAHESTSRLSPG